MNDFTKKQCIKTLESFGWTYKGFLDIGWGEKFYTFTSPEKATVTMKLGALRRKAYGLDMYHWMALQTAKERVGF